MARVEDGGGGGCFALNDDLLLHIFASYLDDTADLLRCAATCRRGRRLVASEAGFITCRRKPPGTTTTRARVWNSSRPAAPPGAFDGDLLRNSRFMASRNGRLLLELRCGSRDDDHAASLRLAPVAPLLSSRWPSPHPPNLLLLGRCKEKVCAARLVADFLSPGVRHRHKEALAAPLLPRPLSGGEVDGEPGVEEGRRKKDQPPLLNFFPFPICTPTTSLPDLQR
ncbi:hypothetical protein SETIT_7G313900v2 [Setaria italica]|uniref:F-box domain-containing protein n=1 Tax=Setaria italica TaxID=4555 RepID=A0A368S1S7_SETIT|nr:hypothetical protein SETIT_7G313900v2 [Setaria italica]